MILPLYGGKSQPEVVALITGYKDKSGYDIVANHWKKQLGKDAGNAWEQALRDGIIANVKEPVVKASVDVAKVKAASAPETGRHRTRSCLLPGLLDVRRQLC